MGVGRLKLSRLWLALVLVPLLLIDWQHYLVTKLPKRPIQCPAKAFTVVVFGQSDATNTGDRRRSAPGYFFFDGNCYPLRDPILGASSGGGSIWPAFAKEVGRPTVIINGSVNGLSISDLSKAPLARLQSSIALAQNQGLRPDLVIFMQGETDAAAGTSAGAYLASLRQLKAALPYRWLITHESACESGRPSPLKAARLAFARDPSVTLGPNLDELGLEYRLADQCHFNRKGQNVIARSLARAL